MVQIKVGLEDKTMDLAGKVLLASENGDVTKSNEANEGIKTSINSNKIV